jgi:hypothetical protein
MIWSQQTVYDLDLVRVTARSLRGFDKWRLGHLDAKQFKMVSKDLKSPFVE